MSVQYKSADGWKNISSSSNNAVDTVENGNMNPVTSNAVYDKLKVTNITGLTVDSHVESYTALRMGDLVIVSIVVGFEGVTTNTYIDLITGLPKNKAMQSISVPNEYGNTGTATFMINGSGTVLAGKCSTANNFYYAQIVYLAA